MILPKYPVYIISKGRYESRLTARALDEMNCPYRLVIEPQEHKLYCAHMRWSDEEKLLVLPFSNLGLGSIPARNWVWDHARESGASRHWILDDNIGGFCRFNHNKKYPCDSAAIFRAAEDFVDRYENVAIAGFNYRFFIDPREKYDPFRLNTRIYSCILLKNDLPYEWRGRYNEDTDLSIRALKDGWCTVLFLTFLADKAATMTVKGGNTTELYEGDGRLKMAKSLKEQHPDIVKITRKWGRWQHTVDYSGFAKNELRLRPDIKVSEGVNNYGMILSGVKSTT